MNVIHKKQYYQIIENIRETTTFPINKILDIGCGGGIAVKEYSKIFPEAIVYGIDHSKEMVELSARNNSKKIMKGKIIIQYDSVENINIESNTIDIVSAFDTISFWDNEKKAIEEIKRVLRKNGILYIVNGFPKLGTKWYDIVKFKNQKEYEQFLTDNGFTVIEIIIHNRTIIVKSEITK